MGPYARLLYFMDPDAVPFSCVLATFARGGFLPVTGRAALLEHSWSLKWLKHPLHSDFIHVRPRSFQKLNHFPGTWRLGRKDTLHQQCQRAAQRWSDFAREVAVRENCCGGDAATRCSGCGLSAGFALAGQFPSGWVLPDDSAACQAALRHPAHQGQLFIVKPASSAAGRGMSLITGGPGADLPAVPSPSPLKVVPNSHCNSRRSRPPPSKRLSGRAVVQRYIDNPYLIHGYKFDLRLYIVITCYEPLRMYLYREGLVRFATTPYYTNTTPQGGDGVGGSPSIAAADNLTAHLTNFTLNKKSEEFVMPHDAHTSSCRTSVGNEAGGDGAKEASPSPPMVSKWCLAALRAYMTTDGVEWEATWRRIQDLLARTFLSVLPDVRAELRGVHDAQSERGLIGRRAPTAPPCTVGGISPFFEIYGVDVLLQHSTQRAGDEEARTGAGLRPTLMEVNIMPSLSTHYAPLDQCIKGNFVADALTLVGVTSAALKPSSKPTPCPGAAESAARGCTADFRHMDAFFNQLSCREAVEACMTLAEERQRAPHFDCVLPSATSFTQYEPLYCTLGGGEDDTDVTRVGGAVERRGMETAHWALDKVLSEWIASKAIHA